jgi:hypothetical protein
VREVVPLTPEEWFTTGHDVVGEAKDAGGIWIPQFAAGVRLWVPPPAVADVAIEQMRFARHRRQNSMHIFICPRCVLTPGENGCTRRRILFAKYRRVLSVHGINRNTSL